ncbi:MAG: glycosyltransferase [Coriobacteriia bacterium]|nr:glycosyltransferase [Coriobacteriia bacterium]
MKILVVTRSFPPVANTGVFRPLRLVRGLVQAGHEVKVLTVDEPGSLRSDPTLLDFIPAGVTVVRIPSGGTLRRKLVRLSGGRLVELYKLYQRLLKFKKNVTAPALPYPLFSGESNAWMIPMIAAGKELAGDCDLIYATVPHWEPLVVVNEISEACGVPFVIDYRDLWTTNPLSPASEEERALEEAILRQASQIITVSESCAQDYRDAFPFLSDKLTVIKNGYDQEMTPSPRVVEGPLRLIYTGELYGGRTVSPVIEALRLLPQADVRFDIYGVVNRQNRQDLSRAPSNVRRHGFVPRNVALEKLAEADISVISTLPGDKTALPQKMYDTIALGKQVLYLGDADAEIVSFLDEFGLLNSCPAGPEKLAVLLCGFISKKKQGKLTPVLSEQLNEYETASQTQEFLAVFEKALTS